MAERETWLADQPDNPGLTASWMADSESYWRGLVGEFEIRCRALRRRDNDSVTYWGDAVWQTVAVQFE